MSHIKITKIKSMSDTHDKRNRRSIQLLEINENNDTICSCIFEAQKNITPNGVAVTFKVVELYTRQECQHEDLNKLFLEPLMLIVYEWLTRQAKWVKKAYMEVYPDSEFSFQFLLNLWVKIQSICDAIDVELYPI